MNFALPDAGEKVGRTRLALKAESLNEFSKSKAHKLGKEMVADGI